MGPILIPILLLAGIPLCLSAPTHNVRNAAASSESVTILFQNDGNWTSHGQTPSAMLVNKHADYQEAASVCQNYGETLLDCSEYGKFQTQFSYQQYLGNIRSDQQLWSACSSTAPTDLNGDLYNTTEQQHPSLPFICTNNAPLVSSVDTDFSNFPKATVHGSQNDFEGLRDHMSFRFMGIPYAEPPVGSLRFQHAVDYTGNGSIDATSYSPACLQFGWFYGNTHDLNPWGNSEDCLYLNVFTSSLPGDNSNSSALKPVMFWIHGGGSVTGTGSDATFDGASLVSRTDVVLVTINYRLNVFGNLAFDDGVITGNYGMSDHVSALRWVQKHIKSFGGDPNSVTVFGQSAGGGATIDLSISPPAKGLFQNAIVQSGGRGHASNASSLQEGALPILAPYCNGTGTQMLTCLQGLPADLLLNLTSSGLGGGTVTDGYFMPDFAVAQVAKGNEYINDLNYLTGYMPEEGQSLLEDTLAPNATNFTAALQVLEESQISEEAAQAIVDSGLWRLTGENGSESGAYDSVYNASVSIVTDSSLTCGGTQLVQVGAASAAYKSLWVYLHERAYGLSYYDFYDLCTFPVGEPSTPYYRCHSGDLYEVFGTYYLFDLPIRVAEDIYYTNAVQDMWASFARTGNPNVESDYLKARGYQSTLDFFGDWEWQQFHSYEQNVAQLQYPNPGVTGLPALEQCEVLLPFLGM